MEKLTLKNRFNEIHEFTVKTELSSACKGSSLYSRVTTISPLYVLVNRTTFPIIITQGNDDTHE